MVDLNLKMLPLSVGVSILNRVCEPERSQHYNFSAAHTRQWSMRNSKCGTLNYKVQESQVECWKGWRWIKWQSEKQHRWDDCQITGRLFSVCHSDKVVLSPSRWENQKRLGGAQKRQGKLFFPFFCVPSQFCHKVSRAFKEEKVLSETSGAESMGLAGRKGTILETWISMWKKKTKGTKSKGLNLTVVFDDDVFKCRLSVLLNCLRLERRTNI